MNLENRRMEDITCRVQTLKIMSRLASCTAENADSCWWGAEKSTTWSHAHTRKDSLHGVPERRSNQRGGWGGVTPCVVSPPHCLPTKRATFTPKYDRLLAPWGCHGERHQWPVRCACFWRLEVIFSWIYATVHNNTVSEILHDGQNSTDTWSEGLVD